MYTCDGSHPAAVNGLLASAARNSSGVRSTADTFGPNDFSIPAQISAAIVARSDRDEVMTTLPLWM